MNNNHWHLETPYGELTGCREKMEAYVRDNPAIYGGESVSIWRNSCEVASISAVGNDDDPVLVEGFGVVARAQARAIKIEGHYGPFTVFEPTLRAAFAKAATDPAYKEGK